MAFRVAPPGNSVTANGEPDTSVKPPLLPMASTDTAGGVESATKRNFPAESMIMETGATPPFKVVVVPDPNLPSDATGKVSIPVTLSFTAELWVIITYVNVPVGSRTTAVGCPLVGGRVVFCATPPFTRSRLKVSMSGLPCVETTTSPLFEDEYVVLHATRTAIEIRTATPSIQVNLVRILRFISCEHTNALPGSHHPRAGTLYEGVNCHPFVYQEWAGRANATRLVGTAETAACCLGTVVPGQVPVGVLALPATEHQSLPIY